MARKRRKPRPTDVCPHCGAQFPEGRPACPECGSDAETGWSREGLTGEAHGLPDEFSDEDYEDVLRGIGALPEKRLSDKRGRELWIAVVGLIVVAAMLWWVLGLGAL